MKRHYPSISIVLLVLGFIIACGGNEDRTAEENATSTINREQIIGILKAPFPSEPSHANPDDINSFLKQEGYQTRVINETDFATPEVLSPENMDIVILPYGKYFHQPARKPFTNYLKEGGAFISMGGYAFDELGVLEKEQWNPAQDLESEEELSGRRGEPGDSVQFNPEQIVLFDPSYTFTRATQLVKGESSPLFIDLPPEEVEEFEGFPATALSGSNNPVFPRPHARWYSLVDAQDAYDRTRGSAFAMMFHHDGPYENSAWAFSAVTSENIVHASHPLVTQSMKEAIQAMRTRTFLVQVEAQKQEEGSHQVIATVTNRGAQTQEATLTLLSEDTQLSSQPIELTPGQTQTYPFTINASQVNNGYTPFTVELHVGNIFRDRLQTAIVNPSEITNKAKPVTFQDNYFHVGNEPRFLLGSNQTGMMLFSPRENPAVWDRDFQRMRDHGLRVLRVLHISPFAAQGFEGKGGHSSMDLGKTPPKKLINKLDALVAMAAQHGIYLILTLHDWLPVTLTNEELEAQQQWGKFWAARYQDEHHVMFDIQNEPSVRPEDNEKNRALFNEYLQTRYANDEELKNAWGDYAPAASLGELPCDPGPEEWHNPRAHDYHLFRAWLIERWIEANQQGIREGNPDALVTVGFLQHEWPADKFLPIGKLDFMQTHYHGPLEGLPPVLKMADRRLLDKGLTFGEFGAWAAHEARKHGRFEDPTIPSLNHFIAASVETFGMGGAMALNWDLKDLNDCIFPWGLTYAQDNVPKPWFKAYRNVAFLLSTFTPQYQRPDIWLLIPDNHRLGANIYEVHRALRDAVSLLLSAHVSFGIINEKNLDTIPQDLQALIWPIPYCSDDRVVDKVKTYAENGGRVYFSGDIGFDAMRRPVKENRNEEILIHKKNPVAFSEVKAATQETQGLSLQYHNGFIQYHSKPPLKAPKEELNWNPFLQFFDQIPGATIAIEPNDPNLHLHKPTLQNNNSLYLFYRNEEAPGRKRYNLQLHNDTWSFTLEGYQSGLLELNEIGDIISFGGSGLFSKIIQGVNDEENQRETLAVSSKHFFLKSLDQMDIKTSNMLLLLPTEEGRIRLWNTGLTNPLMVVGEIVNGKWVTYEEEEIRTTGGRLLINMDENQAASMILITADSLKPVAIQNLMSLYE